MKWKGVPGKWLELPGVGCVRGEVWKRGLLGKAGLICKVGPLVEVGKLGQT